MALSIFVYVCDAKVLFLCMNQLKEGLFDRFLMELWLPSCCRVQLLQRRKICIFGLIRASLGAKVDDEDDTKNKRNNSDNKKD